VLFENEYSNLESDFKQRAEADGDVFIPMIRPPAKVDYVLIGSEPSFDRWAKSPEEAQRKVLLGYKNSATTLEDFVFHLSVQRYLGRSYYVTDLSKGAMLVEAAKIDPWERYDRWVDLLREELELVSHRQTHVFAVGGEVSKYLDGRITYAAKLPHFSGQASGYWKKIKEANPAEYERFAPSVSLGDVLRTAEAVMSDAGMHNFAAGILMRMKNLPDSRKWLSFAYRVKVAEWRDRTG
jgi:hypothetical protein